MTILDFFKRVNSINVDEMMFDIIRFLDEEIILRNLKQLDDGFSSKGEKFESYKSDAYARFKKQLNPDPGLGNPDLKVTGEFWSRFEVDIRSRVIEIFSTDGKAPSLEKKYPNIYGLVPTHLSEIIEMVFELFMASLRSKLGLR